MFEKIVEYPFLQHRNRINSTHFNKERVTVRALLKKGNAIEIFISIGKTIAEIVDFKLNDRINFFIHRSDKNIILLKKSVDNTGNTIRIGTNFYRTSIRSRCFDINFKISQTIEVEYEIEKEGQLLVNISKLKWRN